SRATMEAYTLYLCRLSLQNDSRYTFDRHNTLLFNLPMSTSKKCYIQKRSADGARFLTALFPAVQNLVIWFDQVERPFFPDIPMLSEWADTLAILNLSIIGVTKMITSLKNAAPVQLSFESILTSLDRKSTRLNSSHVSISYAVFCL